MCYSAQQSIIALTINVVSCFTMFYYLSTTTTQTTETKNQLMAITVFLLFVGGMQLWDTIFWLNSKKSWLNQAATKAAMIWNNLEPVILAVAIVYFLGQPLKTLSKYMLYFYVGLISVYSFFGWFKLNGTGQTPASQDSLFWEWNHLRGFHLVYPFFLFTILTLIYQHFSGWIKWFSFLLMLGTFLFSFIKFEFVKSTGRYWCYFAAFAPLIYLAKLLLNARLH